MATPTFDMLLFCSLGASVAAAASGVSGTLTDKQGRVVASSLVSPLTETFTQFYKEIFTVKGEVERWEDAWCRWKLYAGLDLFPARHREHFMN